MLDGKNLLPLLLKNKSSERTLYWHFPAYLEPYGGMAQKWRQVPASAIRQGDWKLIENFETGTLELYNLKDDLSESQNLVETESRRAKKLHETLKKWRKKTQAPMPSKLNPEYKATER